MAIYDYLLVEIEGGAAGRAWLADRIAKVQAQTEDLVLGLFAAQLGWQASEAAVLVERTQDSAGAAAADIGATPGLTRRRTLVMRPTLRPLAGARLPPGGVWVHRTFEIRSADLATFIALSGEAWPDFEGRFDARVFGLFEVTEPRSDPAVVELLLLTRYASHGEWEASREPGPGAMQAFARRAALTRRTRAASSLLVPTPASRA
jgi:hypothetical protein